MRRQIIGLILTGLLPLCAQSNPKRPKVSREPLDAERLAIYQFVAGDFYRHHYSADQFGRLTVSDVTEPLGAVDKGCLAEAEKSNDKLVHRLPPEVIVGLPVTIGRPVEDGAALYLSEIVFDKAHRHAAIDWALGCGNMCGESELIVLEKSPEGTWRIAKNCGGTIS